MKNKNIKQKWANYKQEYRVINAKFKNLSQKNQWKFKTIIALKSLLYFLLCIVIYGIIICIVIISNVKSPYKWLGDIIFWLLSIILLNMVLIVFPFNFLHPTKLSKLLKQIDESKNK